MKTRFAWLLLLVLSLCCFKSTAQCGEFARFLSEGDGFSRAGEYSLAIYKYQSAMTDCPELVSSAQERIQRLVATLELLKDTIENDLMKLDAASDSVNARMCKVELLRRVLEGKIDSLNEVLEMVVGLGEITQTTYDTTWAIIKRYPMNGKQITLARRPVGRRRFEYFYIDVDGQQITKLRTWTYATEFGSDSLAIVRNGNHQYQLKTNGKKLKMSIGIAKYPDEAVDYSDEDRRSLPERVYLMPNLKILKANNNRLLQIPKRIKMAGSLEEVYLADNRLDRFNSLVRLRGLTKLELPGNGIRNIPRKVSKLGQLQVLNLSDNEIWTIPVECFHLRQLRTLNLSYNHISELGSEVGGLKNLEILDLSGNNFVAIPHSLTRLKNLRILELTGNRIQWLDEYKFSTYLKEMTGLVELHIGHNPCSNTEEKRIMIKKFVSEWLPNCTVLFN